MADDVGAFGARAKSVYLTYYPNLNMPSVYR